MKKLLTAFLILCSILAYAQQDLTLYNMRYLQQASFTNPAFFSECKVNIGFPGFASTAIRVGNNGFTWKDLVELGPDDSLRFTAVNALDAMKDLNYFEQELRYDVVHFGFRLKQKNYISLNISARQTFRWSYPQDLFTLMFLGNGMTEAEATAQGIDPAYALLGKRANLDGTGIDAMAFGEVGIQYARKLLPEDKLTVGIRPKMLLGGANIYTRRSTFGLHTNATTYELSADSDFEVNTSLPLSSADSSLDISPSTFFSNLGFGIDLGATYDLNEKIQLSGAVTDLGYIRWKNNPTTYTLNNTSASFRGIVGIEDALLSDKAEDSSMNVIEQLGDSLSNIFKPAESKGAYTTWLTTRINLGANYQFAKKHNLGLLVNTHFVKRKLRAAMTLSYNFRVTKWFGFSANYSIYNRSYTNAGVGLSFNIFPVQFYFITDNILAIAPYNTRNVHFRTGINLTFGCKTKDSDKDGIPNKDDDCPKDPGPADLKGCPDTDGDGLIDKLDSCVTEKGPKELNGCPDTDGDGIIDGKDECPDEPGTEATKGCPDSDADGLINLIDSCPDVAGIPLFQGCPDTDNDSIQDSVDKCPDLPGPMENNGCPDSDKDGLTDDIDQCPSEAGPIENNGCPIGDRDGDGIKDNEDKCPQTPGPASNQGCPQVEKEEQEVLNTAFDNLEFEPGKDILKPSSYESLNRLAELLMKKEGWRLQISGHTDNEGSTADNMRLSELRAKAVSNYLQEKGVERRKLFVQWYGESKPITTNTTPEGRKKNRRVEMEVIFE